MFLAIIPYFASNSNDFFNKKIGNLIFCVKG